ncbi:ribose-5-phosphate isomerase A [Parvularcula bermudensis HTCC2503]|uniref:Ribose-5-phosphate isomerase A n=1 Tax=Parvularcula bermudensis (strain ATCC BAA-594 / HTCC2503 / KCTC 12087) TaxID=314260 RepID=E0TBP1_PARBH|nr:ribose-5-phosphate isomerase RpiA [Parvularcula bermudensis]ADM09762.1 ribose-5-phosphate isomerase A [Parvularcula bermudensis HTCC2503]
MSDDKKQRAAAAALAHVRPGMTLGLGTGSTAAHFVKLLGDQGFEGQAIPTSEETARLAEAVGISLITPDETTRIDLAVDGADEADPSGALIKGGGGALLREKIIAQQAQTFIVIADDGKDVVQLGQFPLPVEVTGFAVGLTIQAIRSTLAALGYEDPSLTLRRGEGGFFQTDGGHLIVDIALGRIDEAEPLDAALTMIPGVVTTGLFVGLTDLMIFGTESGVREAVPT